VTSEGTPNATGWLEVLVDGALVFSKKNGDGYLDSDAKKQRVFQAIERALNSSS
jgi:selT/selW/selH-like putative selenoprotein